MTEFPAGKSDEDAVTADFDGNRAVVGPQVERASARQVKASVVPVAGKDPVGDRAAVEWKAHVRAAIVDGVDLVALRKQTERVPVEVDDESPCGA
jgi:hypothetical protein